ncbi:MFS transporter [Rhodococcus erythropolis]|nr:MFS transporter [Rhodococcus erythropolis]
MAVTATPAQIRVGRARWYRIGLMLFVIYLITFVDQTSFPIATPLISTDLQLAATATGVLLSAFFWGYIITQIPGGVLAARFGPKRVMLATLAIWGLCAVLCATIPNYGALIAIRFAMGLAAGALWSTFAVIVANWYPTWERGRAATFTVISIPLAAVIASLSSGWLTQALTWHWVFISLGLAAFVMAALFAVFGADSPDTDRRLTEGERNYILAGRRSESTPGSFARGVLRRPMAWILGGTFLLWQSAFYGVALWLPSLVAQAFEISVATVSLVSIVPFVVAVLVMLLNSLLSDKSPWSRGWNAAVPLLIGGAALLAGGYVHGAFGVELLLLYIAVAGLYAGLGPWWAWVIDNFSRSLSGGATGFVNFCGNLGLIVGPILVTSGGVSAQPSSSLSILGGCALISAIVIIVLSTRRNIKRTADAPARNVLAEPRESDPSDANA